MKRTKLLRKTPMKRVGFKKKPFSQLRVEPSDGGYPVAPIKKAIKKAWKNPGGFDETMNSFGPPSTWGYVIKTVKSLKPRKRLKPRSKKRVKDEKEYSRLRKEFLADHFFCQVRGCFHPATQIHHKGRRGKHLNNTKLFLAVCGACHRQIEDHSDWAKKMGYTLTVQQRRLLG